MTGLEIFLIWLALAIPVIVLLIIDLRANPYRIEVIILGDPPAKVFVIYERGPQLNHKALFYTRDEAERWINAAKELQKP